MSGTNALCGVWLIFTQASIIHKILAAKSRLGEKGKAISAKLPRIAPINRKGLLLPNFVQILSLRVPTTGWTIIPIIGPASHIKPKIAAFAPSGSTTLPVRFICIAHANCRPIPPIIKLISCVTLNLGKTCVSLLISGSLFLAWVISEVSSILLSCLCILY